MRPASLPTAGRSSPRWPNNSPSIIKPAHPECLHRQLVQPHRLSRDQRPISFNGCPHKRNRRVHSVGFWRGFPSRLSGPQTLSGTRLAASLSDVGARSMDSPRSFSRKWGATKMLDGCSTPPTPETSTAPRTTISQIMRTCFSTTYFVRGFASQLRRLGLFLQRHRANRSRSPIPSQVLFTGEKLRSPRREPSLTPFLVLSRGQLPPQMGACRRCRFRRNGGESR